MYVRIGGEGAGVEVSVGRWLVDRMIRRAVRRSFHNVYWRPPEGPVAEPAIFVANHHGWHDGYVMYLALSQLGLVGVHDWIQEFDAFPLFAKVGGMPFPADDPVRRAETVRRSIRLIREQRHSLLLFAEGILHRPPELLPFGKSLDFLAAKAPEATIVPVAIKYLHSIHERPEAFIWFGDPVERGPETGRRTRLAIASLLDRLAATIASDTSQLPVLQGGTKDVNERMDMRKIPWLRARSGKSNGARRRNEK